MAIANWEPFQDLVATRQAFNSLFNRTFAQFFGGGAAPGAGTWIPAVDIYETDDKLILKAELPGVDPNEVAVSVDGNTLRLKGQRKLDAEVQDENYIVMERDHGSFSRSFALPSSIDRDKVHAEYKNGVLTLTLPKREEAKPKTIKVLASKN
jgi:HSP20 family protein